MGDGADEALERDLDSLLFEDEENEDASDFIWAGVAPETRTSPVVVALERGGGEERPRGSRRVQKRRLRRKDERD